MRFQAIGNYTITDIYIPYQLYSSGEVAKKATFVITDDAGAVITTTSQYTGALASGSYGSSGVYIVHYTVSIPITGGTLASPAVLRIRFSAAGNDGNLWLFNDNTDPFDGSNPLNWNYVDNGGGNTMRLIGSHINSTATTTRYAPFVGFRISTGSSCDRLPVIAKIGSCGAAPVDLINFYAEKQDGRTVLNWLTASEINNDYFAIERSFDGINFEVIGKVKGMGNANGATVYSFADENAPSGKVYYRLTQYDYDGQSTKSFIISVENETNLSVKVAPNPFNNSTEVAVNFNSKDKASVKVTDLSGHLVYESSLSNNGKVSLGDNLPAGIYLLQVQADSDIKTFKIIKQ